MLTMNAIQSLEYYSNLANEDYYLDGGEPSGEWAGKGSVLLGVRGIVDIDEYKNIMRGYSPSGDESLCANPGDEHRSGWDLTFSPPKSVSVAWARSNEIHKLRIQKAHKEAVLAALKHLEKHAAITRRKLNGTQREATVGLVAALFEHSTSRAQDPQLHTHCLIANVAPRQDGGWGSIESRDLYLWQRSAGAMYRTELASLLRVLGFSIEADRDAFQIIGVPKQVCEYYSKRAQRIREELAKMGNARSASKVGDIAALNTRERKTDIDRQSLYKAWHKELDTKGFTEVKLNQLLNLDEQGLAMLQENDAQIVKPILDERTVVELLTEKVSVFRSQDAYKVAAELSQVSGDNAKVAEQVAKRLLDKKETIALGSDGRYNHLYTTTEIVDSERKMITVAKKLRLQKGFGLPDNVIDTAINSMNFTLSEEQQQAVKFVCQENRFAILQGSAGAGKSSSMDCVRDAYETMGFSVVGAAIAKSAADNLSQDANIETFTIAKLLMDTERGRSPLVKNSVLLVDEAGQVGTKNISKLLEAADVIGCKIVLVGEDKQLDAIEHGGCLRYLSRPEVLGTTRINIIRRQREEWARQTVADFRDGNALAALKEYKKRGLLNFCEDALQAKEDLVNTWHQFSKNNPDKKSLLIAQRWKDVSELNEKVRAIFQQEGKVQQKEIKVDCCVSDRLIRTKMAIGERVKFTHNDYRRGYTNGDLGTIVGIDKLSGGDIQFDIETDSNRKIRFKASEYCNEKGQVYLTQAYALTVYASQGLTVDGDVFVYYNSGMDRANTYVAGSRHKDNCHFFVNTKELAELVNPAHQQMSSDKQQLNTLAALMASENRKKLAIEYIDKQQKKLYKELPAIKLECTLGL